MQYRCMSAVKKLFERCVPNSWIPRDSSAHADAVKSSKAAVPLRCLDTPTAMPTGETFELAGWFACAHKISRVVFLGSSEFEIPLQTRPDVAAAHVDFPYAVGFRGAVPVAALNSTTIRVRGYYEDASNGGFIDGLFPLPIDESQRIDLKGRKFTKLSGHLCCPKCSSGMGGSVCQKCGAAFEFNERHLNFLPPDLREQFKISDTANISANGYDETAVDIICNHADGLVLDCGAGFRALEYPNVINFEIVNYPSTDVLGVNERLPFADNTFDAAFSLAVLEHVKDPFASAKEIARVLKPGGVLYCVVPLLQPVHGYPHHYYNMTSQGLQNLFEEMDIQQSGVLKSGLPIWTLTWFLRSWVDGLSGSTKKSFLDLKVSDLIGDPLNYLNQPYVEQLGAQKNLELASSTMILATKKI